MTFRKHVVWNALTYEVPSLTWSIFVKATYSISMSLGGVRPPYALSKSTLLHCHIIFKRGNCKEGKRRTTSLKISCNLKNYKGRDCLTSSATDWEKVIPDIFGCFFNVHFKTLTDLNFLRACTLPSINWSFLCSSFQCHMPKNGNSSLGENQIVEIILCHLHSIIYFPYSKVQSTESFQVGSRS